MSIQIAGVLPNGGAGIEDIAAAPVLAAVAGSRATSTDPCDEGHGKLLWDVLDDTITGIAFDTVDAFIFVSTTFGFVSASMGSLPLLPLLDLGISLTWF